MEIIQLFYWFVQEYVNMSHYTQLITAIYEHWKLINTPVMFGERLNYQHFTIFFFSILPRQILQIQQNIKTN